MQKGFTLIEVLAVLLILSIVAVITTPIITNVIKTSKENAFIQDANGLVESIRNYQAKNNNKAVTVNYSTNSNTNLLEIDGDKPDGGQISINEAGKVALALWDEKSKICVVKDYASKEIVKSNKTKAQCKL